MSDIGFIHEIVQFIYDQRVLGIFAGAYIGLASSNMISALKTNILDNYVFAYLKKINPNIIFGQPNILYLLTSIIEFLVMVFLLYLLLRGIIPYIHKQNEKEASSEKQYKDTLLATLNNINNKLEKI